MRKVNVKVKLNVNSLVHVNVIVIVNGIVNGTDNGFSKLLLLL